MIQEQKISQEKKRLFVGLITGALCLLLFEHIALAVGLLSIYMSGVKGGGGSIAFTVGLLLIGAGIASGIGCLTCIVLLAKNREDEMST